MLEDFPATVNRDVDDSSITHESKRRDFFVLLGGLLCIGGEDKNSTDKFEVALGECEAKHKGANAAMYGSLGYILLIIMAGTDFGVYAMPVEAGASTPERLVPRFSIAGPPGRRRALLIFINITRWLRTIHVLRLLPPSPVLPLLQPMPRTSPFPGGSTTMTMHRRSVHKVMVMPTDRVQMLLDVYGMLSTGRPCTVRCTSFKVGTQLHELRHPIRRVRFSRTEMQSVELQLTPVAARWQLRDIRAAHQLCGDMLHALSAVHSEGFVHRDVRADNILLSSTSFVLIDWELAGRVDDAVFWQPRSEHVPPGVRQGSKWQTWMDLWQLGRVLEAPVSMLSSAAARDYITKLCNGHFSSAEVALQSLTVW
eukprot:TRINITY_DN987_c0_g1_i2.p1 TRINITY_DN987_c0_g1~~TRINITY_DN987_c0_g1_i2.p1  ORF type:complete len:367 (-),score=73.78 TRINITY_DN987_c0_g1_i2:165-1265(-)